MWRAVVALVVAATCGALPAHAGEFSMRFFGQAVPNVNRVMVRLDPHVPADVGAGDFTIEFWMKANAADNTPSSECRSGSGENWITGNIVLDRAIWEHDRHGDYGLALFRTGPATAIIGFGMFQGATGHAMGLCGWRNVGDGRWHHVAVTRDARSGKARLYVDGVLDVEADGPLGNVSYADGVPSQAPSYIRLNVDHYLGIGAEKFDADATRYPSYSGFLDELRFSTVVRYRADFRPPAMAFSLDAATAALFRFDEGQGTTILDSAPGGRSVGERRYGGEPAGPVWSSDTPFTVNPAK
jgi:Concanavalin A-like lectin/glucanases superfamily